MAFQPQIIRKALFLIGVGTKTAESEHELMKAAGRVLCPRVFCLDPAEKRDTLCSASELSAAIMVYTASPEPYPRAFWHGAACSDVRKVWMSAPSSREMLKLRKQIKDDL